MFLIFLGIAIALWPIAKDNGDVCAVLIVDGIIDACFLYFILESIEKRFKI